MASSGELLKAVRLATRTLSGTGQIDQVLPEVLGICVEAVGASGGTIYLHDEANRSLIFRHVLPEEVRQKLEFENIPDDFGIAGKAFQTRETIISVFERNPDEPPNRIEEQTGVRVANMVTVPLQMEHELPIGVVQLINKRSGNFDESDVIVLDTVAAVATMAYLNAKLTDESTRASTLLGMGKVSHDIGNLAASLHATINFTDMAIEGLEGELRQAKDPELMERYVEAIGETLADLRSSVDRIVGYSRLVSDLSAGRELRPEKKLASLAQTIQTSAAYLESEGRKNNVELRYEIETGAPAFAHDELYFFRIVQNLVGNAIKAVHETSADSGGNGALGQVVIRYRLEGGNHIIEVQDSGPGMPKEIADRILAGNARSQWAKGSGSGWGTKIVLELAATHGGVVSIDSEPGKGTTFRVTCPG